MGIASNDTVQEVNFPPHHHGLLQVMSRRWSEWGAVLFLGTLGFADGGPQIPQSHICIPGEMVEVQNRRPCPLPSLHWFRICILARVTGALDVDWSLRFTPIVMSWGSSYWMPQSWLVNRSETALELVNGHANLDFDHDGDIGSMGLRHWHSLSFLF